VAGRKSSSARRMGNTTRRTRVLARNSSGLYLKEGEAGEEDVGRPVQEKSWARSKVRGVARELRLISGPQGRVELLDGMERGGGRRGGAGVDRFMWTLGGTKLLTYDVFGNSSAQDLANSKARGAR
jgi:hypothetical protein